MGQTNQKEIENLIAGLSDKTSHGHDSISNILLKMPKYFLSLTNHFQSINDGRKISRAHENGRSNSLL